MKMLKSFTLSTVVVMIVGYGCCLARAHQPTVLLQVHQKLVDYVTQSKPTSGLTMDELRVAYDQFASLAPEVRARLREAPPSRLLLDFVIVPFGSAEHQLLAGDQNYQKFIQRSEQAYREFWPIYQGSSEGEYIHANHFNRLLKYATGELPVEQLKLGDFVQVDNELKTWRARMDEIATLEDIFSCKVELRRILTYLNSDYVKVLRSSVLPHLRSGASPRELLDQFVRDLFAKHGLKYENGAWTKYVFPPGFDPSTMMNNIHLRSQINNSPLASVRSPSTVVVAAKSSPESDMSLAKILTGAANKQVQQDMNDQTKQPEVRSNGDNIKGPWRLSAPEEEAYL